jgi:transposase InsO family protein
MQGVLDCFSRYAWGRLYTSKLPLTAVQVMHNDVLPFFEEHGVRVQTVLSDNGREYRGRPDQHPYELFLQLEEIEHRTKWYESIEEMQTDLDAYLETDNRKRPHRGRGMDGRTPYTVFKAGLKDAKKNNIKTREEEPIAA